MKLRISLISLLAGFIVILPAHAETWKYLGKAPSVNGDNTDIEIDEDSIDFDSNEKEVWIRASFIARRVGDVVASSGVTLLAIDCKRRQARFEEQYIYEHARARGKLVYETTDPGEWRSIRPNSADALVFRAICKT